LNRREKSERDKIGKGIRFGEGKLIPLGTP